MSNILEHDAALTTTFRSNLYDYCRNYFGYALPKEVDGIFSIYCVQFNPETKKPVDSFLYYVIDSENPDARIETVCQRLKSSYSSHRAIEIPFAGLILLANDKKPFAMYSPVYDPNGGRVKAFPIADTRTQEG